MMYQPLQKRIRKALRRHILKKYSEEVAVVTNRPPQRSMGEIASPVCFDLAKRLKRPPRLLAQEIAGKIGEIEGVARIEVAGAGYLNFFLDRSAFFQAALAAAGNEAAAPHADEPKTIVEHTCINPNKAAHVGHLRNAVLGDTYARLLRHSGALVEVQNYIDNTGVQVADVVLGFLHLEKKTPAEVRALASQPRFDYLCWDLYTRVTQVLEQDPKVKGLRAETLKAIEEGHGDVAEVAALVATSIVHCHLRTLDRLGIDYDLLPQESEILHLRFWDAAFTLLKERGAIRLAASGKNEGCWVMDLPPANQSAEQPGAGAAGADAGAGTADVAAESAGAGDAAEADAKVIVRSNGTVTYVGKDIAYHLWKFGLLGRDFHYQPFHQHPDGHEAWVTSMKDDGQPPAFGQASQLYNVIDSRQAYPQQVVVEGLRALGFADQAAHLTHFAYDVVALTPRCALEMGYEIPPEDAQRPYIEVSGRKGQGVKADDLLDRLESGARAEVDARHPDSPESERAAIAHAIAVGALRYFLLRYTRTTIIAFDFKDALSFDGETGPYVQYAIVRARSIFRKLQDQGLESTEHASPAARATSAPDQALLQQWNAQLTEAGLKEILAAPKGDDLWDLVLLAGSLGAQVEVALSAQEPAFLAKYAFQLAQTFNLFYHKRRILAEEDPQRRSFLLLLAAFAESQLTLALHLLGIEAPEKM